MLDIILPYRLRILSIYLSTNFYATITPIVIKFLHFFNALILSIVNVIFKIIVRYALATTKILITRVKLDIRGSVLVKV